MTPDPSPPPWACSQWGQYEHDWLDCPDCLTAYEAHLEKEPMTEEATGEVNGLVPKFSVGQPVFVMIHNVSNMRRGVVTGSYAHGGEVHYTVLRRDGYIHRYPESDLKDADAGFTLAEVNLVSPGVVEEYTRRLTSTGDGTGKYGTLAALAAKLHPGEPWFVLRGQDQFAPGLVAQYAHRLGEAGLMAAAEDVRLFASRMFDWQAANPEKTKIPD